MPFCYNQLSKRKKNAFFTRLNFEANNFFNIECHLSLQLLWLNIIVYIIKSPRKDATYFLLFAINW